jgi:hypothetical protein
MVFDSDRTLGVVHHKPEKWNKLKMIIIEELKELRLPQEGFSGDCRGDFVHKQGSVNDFDA